jgi:hypothetical protein
MFNAAMLTFGHVAAAAAFSLLVTWYKIICVGLSKRAIAAALQGQS